MNDYFRKITRAVNTVILLLASSALAAQFEENPASLVLDNTEYQFFGSHVSPSQKDWTRGGSSFLNVAGPLEGIPQVGGFVSGDKTITFDWRLQQGSELNSIEFRGFDIFSNVSVRRVQSLSTDFWCRVTVYLPPGTEQVQWLGGGIPETFWLDNVKVVDGNKPAPTECGILGSADREQKIVIPGIIAMLLDDTKPKSPSIGGVLSLPSGVTAPAGGVTFEVQTFPLGFFFEDGFIRTTQTSVTIEEGQTKADYLIALPLSDGFSETFNLEFECESGCDNLDVTTVGSWSDTLGVTSFLGADDYSVNGRSTVNIELELADFFSGTITFADGYQTSGDEQIVATIDDDDFLAFDFFSQYLYPPAGQTQVEFKVSAPSGMAASDWVFSVDCNGCSALSTNNQYATTVTGNPVTENKVNAFRFNKGSDHPNLALTIPAP